MESQDIASRRGAFTVIVGIAAALAFAGATVGAVPAVDGGGMADGPFGPMLVAALLVQVAIIIFLCRYILDEKSAPNWLIVLALSVSIILAATTVAVT
ncbi:hypothetical protein ACQP2T_59455 [Nonomuraea sp. CA-143628]|uniref:hypothetical protein n=1 Tax=Nonomuraea sp. CA-143628 TaxID=3239997 RepID=UPI003D8BB7B2